MTVGVVVPAAGRGERLGGDTPKALRSLAGEPLLVHAVRALRRAPSVDVIVAAAPRGWVTRVEEYLSPFTVIVVEGGELRQDSVALALAALPDEVDLVLVHDAARCLTPPSVVEAVVAALRAGADAVVPVVAVSDTIKQVDGDRVRATLDRASLRAVQTPQGFRREVLAQAHAQARGRGLSTDDAALVEALGRSVMTVPGSDEAFKVTGPVDLILAEAVLRART